MTALAKRIVTAWICGVGVAGALGCEQTSDSDRSKSAGRTGTGCQDASSTSTSASGGGGDGATERLGTVAELEPNSNLADADAAAMTAVKITGSTSISGAIFPTLDQDYVQMSLAQPAIVRLETFDGSSRDCATIQTTLRIRDGAGVQLYADDNSGIFTCSALVVPLPAGSYYVSIEQRTGAFLIPAYVIQASFEASAGVEVEPNDITIKATALVGADAFARGDHAVNADSDFFALTVPAGKSLRAEVIEGNTETCESTDVDSLLTLFDESGMELGSDDDAGRGFCSLIDGTGADAADAADADAHNLATGTYYLLVEAADGARDPADMSGQFAYRLAVTLR
jgi:hypothetical protein